MSNPTTEGSLQPGMLLAGKYLIGAELGQGGNGTVLEARHEQLQIKVAIKVLKGDVDDERKARMLREARIAATLQSDHCVRIIDVLELDVSGSEQGRIPCIIMEYLAGSSLAEKLRKEGPLPATLALRLIRQACEALSEAHSLGLIHRDLKPANLFLTQTRSGEPRLKVVDFGLAKALVGSPVGEDSISQSQVTVGSPAYMSPEQVRASKRVDHRTDIWALGVVLQQLLTNRLPFSGANTAALLAAIAADLPRPLREDLPEAPFRLQKLLDRCLRKHPDERFQTIEELDRELARSEVEVAQSDPPLVAKKTWPEAERSSDTTAEDTAQSMATPARSAAAASSWLWRTALGVLFTGLGLAVWYWLTSKPPVPGEGAATTEVAISAPPARPQTSVVDNSLAAPSSSALSTARSTPSSQQEEGKQRKHRQQESKQREKRTEPADPLDRQW